MNDLKALVESEIDGMIEELNGVRVELKLEGDLRKFNILCTVQAYLMMMRDASRC